jgi:hypothetical protein
MVRIKVETNLSLNKLQNQEIYIYMYQSAHILRFDEKSMARLLHLQSINVAAIRVPVTPNTGWFGEWKLKF